MSTRRPAQNTGVASRYLPAGVHGRPRGEQGVRHRSMRQRADPAADLNRSVECAAGGGRLPYSAVMAFKTSTLLARRAGPTAANTQTAAAMTR